MTISSTSRSEPYVGTGAATPLAVPFVFWGADEIEVIERVIATGVETTKTPTTHYTVSGGDGAVGTVTPVSGAVFPVTVEWHIIGKTKRTQEIDYVNNDNFDAETHEEGLDRGVALTQEIELAVARSPKFPKTDPTSSKGDLPSSVDRANGGAGSYAGYDSAGKPTVLAAPVATSAVSVYMATVLSAASEAAFKAAVNLEPGTDVASAALTLTAGAGLTGGGDLTANRTVAVGAGVGIVANADDVAVDKATQVNMEAAAADKVVTADVLHFHPGVPKCWGNVTYSGGTPSLNASYNVTSISDTGTGQLTVTIANDFADANYTALVTPTVADAAGPLSLRFPTKAAGSLLIETQNSGGSDTDAVNIHWALLGDM